MRDSSDRDDTFKELLEKAEVVSPEYNVTGSLLYFPYGWQIRNNLFGIARNLAEDSGYDEIHIPDLIDEHALKMLDSVTRVSDKYLHVDGGKKSLAASHEVALYPFLSRHLRKNPNALPIRWYALGNTFRNPRSGPYPFNYGERASFFESYGVFEERAEAEKEVGLAIRWNRDLVFGALALPGVEVRRPLETNKPISTHTTCIDTILPGGRTVITGMTYFHDSIFTKLFSVKYRDTVGKNHVASSVHFGVSDNILFSYLETHRDELGLLLSSQIAPHEVVIIYDEREMVEVEILKRYLSDNGFKFKCIGVQNAGKIGKVEKKLVENGTPIQIIYSKERGTKVYTRFDRQSSMVQIDEMNFDKMRLRDKLRDGDAFIRARNSQIKADNIVMCEDIGKVNEALDARKVAKLKIDGPNCDVVTLEEKIIKGEVLGYANEEDDSSLYISRRI